MQKLLKAQYFMNKMHEYELKCFLKTLVLNPDLSKIRFLNNFFLKSQTPNTFCIKIKEFSILDGHKQNHTQ